MASHGRGRKVGKRGTLETENFTFRIKHDLRDKLELITEFEQVLNPTELVRGWVVEKVSGYYKDRRFRAFVAAKG